MNKNSTHIFFSIKITLFVEKWLLLSLGVEGKTDTPPPPLYLLTFVGTVYVNICVIIFMSTSIYSIVPILQKIRFQKFLKNNF